jgi:lipid II:glycine glycyltransferase (peptidoglycan interpeptide bridge formation enzyme)
MPEVSLSEWNRFLRDHPQAHFLQSGEWGELKSEFDWQPSRLIVETSGVQILFRQLPLGFTLGYIPKPAIGQIRPDDAEQIWAEVDGVCRGRRAILCKLERDEWVGTDAERAVGEDLPRTGASSNRPSLHSVQPRRTLIVDLSPPEDSILNRMKQKCRYNIRLAEKKGVIVSAWDDLDGFHAMMRKTGARDGFAVHAAAYYRRAYELCRPSGMCELLVAQHAGRPLAALMVFARGRRAWYVYGGSTGQDRERMPNYLLQWEAMRWAKRHGCEEYDLWGVPDEDERTLEADFSRRQDGLWGVFRFKRGFGGELRRAVQAVDRVYKPLPYAAYLLRVARSGMQ